jgi:hypothetical protein
MTHLINIFFALWYILFRFDPDDMREEVTR